MGVASPAGIPGGGSRGGFEGSGRARPVGEGTSGKAWKVRCVGRERGAAWAGAGGSGEEGNREAGCGVAGTVPV